MKKAILILSILLILLPLAMGQDYYRVRKHTRISTGMDEAAAVPYEDGVVYIIDMGMSLRIPFANDRTNEHNRDRHNKPQEESYGYA